MPKQPGSGSDSIAVAVNKKTIHEKLNYYQEEGQWNEQATAEFISIRQVPHWWEAVDAIVRYIREEINPKWSRH